eukprot:Nitzschia sp. Nitz4//scaffold32_size149145//59066//59968//NITZ4_002877-RA/size149145-augustus-gene-0.36-mRNA-1//1//CDS//3329548063//3900//frame0
MAEENTPLVTSDQAGAVASGAATIINQSAAKIKKARVDGPLTFRTLGFIGGLAMIVSNGLGILDRFFSFNITGSLTAFYGVIFGVLIVLLEMPSIWCLKSGKFNGGVRYYAKFLEFTAGRGAFFFFCGSLQATNFNMLDWAVGGFMMFVGVTAIIAGIMAARDLRLFKFSIANETDLKAKWKQYDANGNDSLDVKELTVFIKESGIDMTRNEVASVFMALDKNFDDCISYEEFYYWWMGESQRIGSEPISV